MRRLLASVVLLTLLTGACGEGDGDDVVTDTAPADSDTDTTAPADEDDDGTDPATAPGDLPGEEIDIFPYEGAELAVVGVATDDVLNLRSGPGTDFDVVVELEPLATGIVATGNNRSLDDSGIWAEVEADGETGWASTRFLLQPGQTTDVTTEIAATPADRPRAETMVELGRMVGEERASEEPASDVVVVDGPTVGDLGEITVDVIGLGDDSVGGERLAIFADPDASGEGFTLRSVEATFLCLRGVIDDGLCV